MFQGVRTNRRQYRPSQQPRGRSRTASTRSLHAVWSGACLGDDESGSSPVVATPVVEVCSVHLNCLIGPLKQYGRYCVHCVITLFWCVSLVFRMCNLPGHEVSLYCVFFQLHLMNFAPQEMVFSWINKLCHIYARPKRWSLKCFSSICSFCGTFAWENCADIYLPKHVSKWKSLLHMKRNYLLFGAHARIWQASVF